MQKNMGIVDRIIRLIIAVVLAILIATGVVTGALAWVLGIVALILLGTSAVGYCGLYKVLGISTLRERGADTGQTHPTGA